MGRRTLTLIGALCAAGCGLAWAGPDGDLTPQEKSALAAARDWAASSDKPSVGANGKVVFAFGAAMPVVVCAPLRVTDIELEPGESVKELGVHAGDTARWQIGPAVSGPAGSQVTHVMVKPGEAGLRTDLVVATDRRTYHLELLSTDDAWMPYVGFAYPEETQAQWTAYQALAREKKAAETLPETGEDLTRLDFRYGIGGDASWRPVRVYSTGTKTVIQMPHQMAVTESPALLVIGDSGDEELVNYRVRGDRYIVDRIFMKAVLVAGVGRHQVRVTITRLAPIE